MNKIIQNQIGCCLAERIVQAHIQNEDFKIYIVIPSVPGVNGILENNTAQERFSLIKSVNKSVRIRLINQKSLKKL